MFSWTLPEAVEICRRIEAIAPLYGCHVALTGGCLFQDGLRKDLDILFYRIRQAERIDTEKLLGGLKTLGIEEYEDNGFCIKAFMPNDEKNIDMFFPERPREEWPEEINKEYQ